MSTTTLTPTPATPDQPKLVKKPTMGETKPAQTTFGCQHVKGLLQAARQQAVDGYTRLIHAIQTEGHVAGKLHKSGDKAAPTSQVTYLCLQCPNVSGSRERHRKDHAFAVESSYGYVFCHECKDFVYDPTFEEVRVGNSRKRKRGQLQLQDKKLVATNTSFAPCAATGLRGLYNMGQTCFMSVVLQSLIHNPLVRSFYLAEGHRHAECEREACTSCALDEIFVDFFSAEKHEGYGAVHMLQGCWKGGGGLAGYSQQDAHEYLGFILDSLHTANTSDDEDEGMEKKPDTNKDCECIIHQTFWGLMKSTVTCSKCGNVTTSLEPFMDLPLDIRNSGTVSVKKKKLTLINGTTTVKEVLPMDLVECLDRFTSIEPLSAYDCRKCESAQEAKKKLSLSRLPPVIPIHLKRFSHSKDSKESSKVDTRIRFPLAVDFSPYLSKPPSKKSSTQTPKKDKDSSKDKEKETPSSPSSKDDPPPDNDPAIVTDPTYELSSVVVHKGKIDNGHYISYSRQEGEWFRFDDSMVVQVDEREVLGAEAYMLFYVAKEF